VKITTAVTLLLLSAAVSASAQDQVCSTQTIKGTYGLVSSIRVVPPPNSTVKQSSHIRFIGLITYDGAGTVTAAGLTVSPNGKSSTYKGSGSYTINPQVCTGSAAFQDQQGNKRVRWDFVIVSGGSQLLTIVENEPNSSTFAQVKR
jgi:hypothetical protein